LGASSRTTHPRCHRSSRWPQVHRALLVPRRLGPLASRTNWSPRAPLCGRSPATRRVSPLPAARPPAAERPCEEARSSRARRHYA
jgi:hypothetical protein